MVPAVTVKGLGSGSGAAQFARSFLIDTIIGNIERRVLDAPDGYVDRSIEPTPIMLCGIDLKIVQP